MTNDETTYDMQSAKYHAEDAEVPRSKDLCFKANMTLPSQKKTIHNYLEELFNNNLSDDVKIMTPVYIDRANKISIGKDVFINHHLTTVALGGIKIGNHVQIAPNVTLLTANHDQDNLQILHCKSVTIKDSAWIGAGAQVLPGVTIGKGEIVAAGAVVTKDVPDNAVVAGVPAKVIRQP